jgi:hypothetical protein
LLAVAAVAVAVAAVGMAAVVTEPYPTTQARRVTTPIAMPAKIIRGKRTTIDPITYHHADLTIALKRTSY